MQIFIASEFRCHIYKGEYYLSEKAYTIYKRYADAFGKMVLCSRFITVDKLEKRLRKADFIEDTIVVESLVKSLVGVYDREIEKKIKNCNLVIGRLPSVTAYRAADIAKRITVPFLAELMCDGWDPYWNHGLQGKLIAPYMHFKMKRVTKHADYAVYVTEKFLQSRYPCDNPSVHASNVLIEDLEVAALKKRLDRIAEMGENPKKISVMTTASIDLLSKGQRYVVRAMGELKKRGLIVIYYLAGAGTQDHLRREAVKAGVEDQLVFLGELTLDQVYAHLDQIDIYIQPSLQEGLPRAVIEAMSRGCPCIGARTAGIPELLDENCIVAKSSSTEIASTIQIMLAKGLGTHAVQNFEHCKQYLEDTLNQRRNSYFNSILSAIEKRY